MKEQGGPISWEGGCFSRARVSRTILLLGAAYDHQCLIIPLWPVLCHTRPEKIIDLFSGAGVLVPKQLGQTLHAERSTSLILNFGHAIGGQQ